jgi:hypothetical protein
MTLKLTPIAITGAALSMALPLAAPTPSHASTHNDVQTMLLRNGDDAGLTRRGDDGRDRPADQYFPGSEQSTLQMINGNEILIFTMASYRINGNLPRNRSQLLCASVAMDPINGPTLNSMQYVTNNDGNRRRNANHPETTKVSFGGQEYVVAYYNYAPDNRARRYAQVFGPGCQSMSAQTQVMQKNNDDCSETHGNLSFAVYEQTETYARIASADGCNGNGRDDAWMNAIRVDFDGDSFSIDKEWDVSIESQEERHRGTIFLPAGTTNLAVECGTAGNNQPPRRGIRCYGVDLDPNGEQGANADSRLLWRQYIERYGDEVDGKDIHPTQIRFAPILDGEGRATDTVLATWQRIEGRRRAGKGSARTMIQALTFSRDGMERIGTPQTDIFPASDATHASICSTLWGTTGSEQPRALMISSSVNGSTASFARAAVVGHDGTQAVLDTTVGLRAAIDNAWLSNIYGNNPNTQGRNFISCNTVGNPGYGVSGGYMSDVKSFMAIPANTRRMREGDTIPEDKLALELVLVPTVIDAPDAPEPGDGDDPDPADGDGDGDGTGNGDGTGDGNGNNGNQNLGGGCAASGGAGSLSSIALLAGALFLLGFRRRRVW